MVAGGNVNFGGIGYPQLMLISAPCGFTVYLNAVLMGLSAPFEPEKPKGEEGATPSASLKREATNG
jgi:hypothetical protein